MSGVGYDLKVGQFPRVGTDNVLNSRCLGSVHFSSPYIYRVLSKRDKSREAASIRSPTEGCYKS